MELIVFDRKFELIAHEVDVSLDGLGRYLQLIGQLLAIWKTPRLELLMQLAHPDQRRPGELLDLGGANSGSRMRPVSSGNGGAAPPQENSGKETCGSDSICPGDRVELGAWLETLALGNDTKVSRDAGGAPAPVFRGQQLQPFTMKILLEKLADLLHGRGFHRRALWWQSEFVFPAAVPSMSWRRRARFGKTDRT